MFNTEDSEAQCQALSKGLPMKRIHWETSFFHSVHRSVGSTSVCADAAEQFACIWVAATGGVVSLTPADWRHPDNVNVTCSCQQILEGLCSPLVQHVYHLPDTDASTLPPPGGAAVAVFCREPFDNCGPLPRLILDAANYSYGR